MSEREKERAVIRKKRAYVDQKRCVACGSCVKVCPLKAIQILRGIHAEVDWNRCVGCGRCAAECPGTLIEIRVVEQR